MISFTTNSTKYNILLFLFLILSTLKTLHHSQSTKTTLILYTLCINFLIKNSLNLLQILPQFLLNTLPMIHLPTLIISQTQNIGSFFLAQITLKFFNILFFFIIRIRVVINFFIALFASTFEILNFVLLKIGLFFKETVNVFFIYFFNSP